MNSPLRTPERIPISGIPVWVFPSVEAAAAHLIPTHGQISSGMAIAINPEKIIRSRAEPELANLLAHAEFTYPDGIGAVWALRRRTKNPVHRIPGCELWIKVMERASELNLPVYLLGATREINQAVGARLKNEMGLQVAGSRDGYFSQDEEEGVIDCVTISGAQIVIVGMGSPRQEQFIIKLRYQMPKALFIGVGGSFDVYSGHLSRAPLAFRKLGLEWAYRLLRQPTRFRRVMPLARFAALLILNRL